MESKQRFRPKEEVQRPADKEYQRKVVEVDELELEEEQQDLYLQSYYVGK